MSKEIVKDTKDIDCLLILDAEFVSMQNSLFDLQRLVSYIEGEVSTLHQKLISTRGVLEVVTSAIKNDSQEELLKERECLPND